MKKKTGAERIVAAMRKGGRKLAKMSAAEIEKEVAKLAALNKANV